MPILKRHCGKCHTGQKKEGGLSMNSRANLLVGGENGKSVIPGNAADSRFLQRIITDDDALRMPPEGPRVSREEATILMKWVDSGLPWEVGVLLGKSAWEPPLAPRRVTLPPSQGRSHPIDRLLDAYLVDHAVATPEPISDAVFLRRVSLDAVGPFAHTRKT